MLLGRSVLLEVGRNFAGSLVASTGMAFFVLSITFLKRTPGVGMGFLLEVFPLFFPLALQFTVPLSGLCATVLTFGRMSADNELLALQAAGGRLRALVLPVVAAGAVLACGSLLLGDHLAPYAAAQLRRAKKDLVHELQTSFRAGKRDLDLGRHQLSFGAFEGDRFQDLTLVHHEPGDPKPKIFRARSGRLAVTEDDHVFIELQDLALPGEEGVYAWGEELTVQIPIEEVVGAEGILRRRSGLRNWELAYVEERALEPKRGFYRVHRYNAMEELARRTAMSASVLFLILAGIPLGILTGAGGRISGLLTATAPVVLLYFPLVIAGSSLARSARFPAYPSLWIGNVAVAIGALVLLRKIARR